MSSNDLLYHLATASDSVLIVGLLVLIVGSFIMLPKAIKFMKHKQHFSDRRFEQEMERHKLLVQVIQDNVRIMAELKTAIDSYKELSLATLKSDRESLNQQLGRIRSQQDSQQAQLNETLTLLSNIKTIMERN